MQKNIFMLLLNAFIADHHIHLEQNFIILYYKICSHKFRIIHHLHKILK